MQIALCCETNERSKELEALAERWQLTHHPDAIFQLTLTTERLELKKRDEPKLGAIYVDWVSGASAHRRKFGGGKGQSIAKAVGLNKGATPIVLDATAGLGRDGFVLAALGCQVILVERHPVVAALLEDGIARAKHDPEIGAWVSERVHLVYGASHQGLAAQLVAQQLPAPDVVYLDPMFPHKKKAALVKKEMRVFQSLVGADLDADALWQPCYELAAKRLVVKRPSYADFLAGKQPSSQICTKNNRFDLYVKAAMK